MKNLLENNKIYYLVITIVIIIILVIVFTGGIPTNITISDVKVVDSGGPIEPRDTGSVVHSTTGLLVFNIIILIISITFSIYCYVIDNKNKFKLIIIVIFLVLAFFTPILVQDNFKNQITIGGEQENMRTDYHKKNLSLIDKILQ